jgi:hypothetical protein
VSRLEAVESIEDVKALWRQLYDYLVWQDFTNVAFGLYGETAHHVKVRMTQCEDEDGCHDMPARLFVRDRAGSLLRRFAPGAATYVTGRLGLKEPLADEDIADYLDDVFHSCYRDVADGEVFVVDEPPRGPFESVYVARKTETPARPREEAV